MGHINGNFKNISFDNGNGVKQNRALKSGYLMAEADNVGGLGAADIQQEIANIIGNLPEGVEIIPEVEIGGGQQEPAPPQDPLEGVEVIPDVEIGGGEDPEVGEQPIQQPIQQPIPDPEPTPLPSAPPFADQYRAND